MKRGTQKERQGQADGIAVGTVHSERVVDEGEGGGDVVVGGSVGTEGDVGGAKTVAVAAVEIGVVIETPAKMSSVVAAAAAGLEPPCCAATRKRTDRVMSESPDTAHLCVGWRGDTDDDDAAALIVVAGEAPAEHQCYLWSADDRFDGAPIVPGTIASGVVVAAVAGNDVFE
jgi:hypothetical protein